MGRILFGYITSTRSSSASWEDCTRWRISPIFPNVKERILDNVWELVEYDGKHYGLPVTMLPFVLAVNTDIMGRMGLEVPKTWDEMLALGPQFAGTGIEPFTMPGASIWTRPTAFLPLLYKAVRARL